LVGRGEKVNGLINKKCEHFHIDILTI